MAKLTTADFIAAIKDFSVLELNDLVKACEEEFGVSAAAGVVVAACLLYTSYVSTRYDSSFKRRAMAKASAPLLP